ncbi:hypothetical protein E3N88_19235 [Mikania micrantha]|uniref:Methyltransferase n=1 Tax=Mikania micrantha TaxID=192012 RepID=A0A5N6NNX8_9ASTR|nr:hypothetical protein E3N88_19235 [Mikania micrantha]
MSTSHVLDLENQMKLVWSPEMASKAYIDTVKICKKVKESDHVELISAMAGGWSPKLIIEAWSSGSNITTSIGLDIAARHLGTRYVCMVQNESARLEYETAVKDHGSPVPELVVGEAKEVMARLQEVEFMVVDGRRNDLYELFGLARLSRRGAVLLCTNANQRCMVRFRWDSVVGDKSRVERSVSMPVGRGLNIAYIKCNRESGNSSLRKRNRWITRIDQKTGEEHVFRG